MASDNRTSAVPIQAHLASIEVVGDLENGSNPGADYFVKVYVDDEKEKVAKSEKKHSVPPPRWEWPEDQKFSIHPSSTIKIVIYRQSRIRIKEHIVGQHSGKVFELLNNDVTLDLENEKATGIASKIKIGLSLIPEPEDSFERFMETVDADVSRLKSTPEVPAAPFISALGTVLQLTKKIIDNVAEAHPILKTSWTIISSVYVVWKKAVKEVKGMDDTIRDLAESLREVLGVANERPDLRLIAGTTDVIENIGRTSLKVMSIIHEYTRRHLLERAVNSQLSGDMKSRIEECRKSCDDLRQKFDRRLLISAEGGVTEIKATLKTIKDDQKAKEIYQWLSAPDSSKNYHEAREQHQGETCSWFLDGTRFHELQETAGFLWIKGTAGCGKTVLCSSVIEKIIELRKENPSVSYAYFFFDGRDSQKDLQLHDKLIRSLVSQLSVQCDGIPTVLVELYGHGQQQPSTRSLQDTLHRIISGLQTTYIIIDSLDECIEREKLLPWIEQIISLSMPNLHMMVVSRPERDISDVLQLLDPNCVDLAAAVDPDITMYLEQQLSQTKNWDDQTREIIKSTLIARAGGMFRWVALQLMELKKCPNRRSVMNQLDSLPKGLYETYDRILSKIDEQPDHTKTFLRWLCFSVRPMGLAEISETVIVDLESADGPQYIPDNCYWDERDVLVKCSGLITESEGNVKLAHFSIKEYLLSEHLRTGGTSLFHLTSAKLSHALISQTCLAYLLQSDALDLARNNEDLASSFPLAHYAAKHWIFHAQYGGIDQSEQSSILTLAQELFTPSIAKFENWINIWDLDNPNYPHPAQTRSLGPCLYYASLANLQRLSVYLLERGADVNMQGGRYGTALQAASAGGHKAIARLLLEHGADVNMWGGHYGSALQAASAGGHEAIARLLLENGADVNTQGGLYGTALQAALVGGHEAIAMLLLKNGADVNVQGGLYGTALQAASAGGQDVIVRLLLENGADMNVQGGRYGSALQAASFRGEEVIVRLLLESGADVNMQGVLYGTALQMASAEGHDTIARLLLENGADVNVQGDLYGTALQAASAEGHDTIVRLLLENRADVNVQGELYGTALQAASTEGHEAIARLLLENGADVNVQRVGYGTALQMALAEGREAIVRLLLENGADVNVQGDLYGTALQAVSGAPAAPEAIARLLLENGADVNAQGGYFGSALQAASFSGQEEIARLLLENGADVNAQGGYYGTALQAASTEKREAIVRLLLQNGADVNAQTGYYHSAFPLASGGGDEVIARLLSEDHSALALASTRRRRAITSLLVRNEVDMNVQRALYGTALLAASGKGYQAIARLLLDNGADVDATGGCRKTALQVASAKGHEAIVRLLLENGADVNAQGEDDGSALQAASNQGHRAIVELLLENGANNTSSFRPINLW